MTEIDELELLLNQVPLQNKNLIERLTIKFTIEFVDLISICGIISSYET
jgi:hypothetical protein